MKELEKILEEIELEKKLYFLVVYKFYVAHDRKI